MSSKKKKPIKRDNPEGTIKIIGALTSTIGLLAFFTAIFALRYIYLNYSRILSENPGSPLYSGIKYILWFQVLISGFLVISSVFFMFRKLWAKKTLGIAIQVFFIFYIFIGIILIYEMNRDMNFNELNSLVSVILSLFMVAIMAKYIHIYVARLQDKINSDKITGLFK